MTLALPAIPKPREISERFNQVLLGKLNNTGTVTLTANVGSTAVAEPICHTGSMVLLMPTTANAATEYGAGTWYISTGNGTFTITHVNNAQTDRTFIYGIMG